MVDFVLLEFDDGEHISNKEFYNIVNFHLHTQGFRGEGGGL